MTQIRLSEVMGPAFYGVHQDVKTHGHTHYVLGGGRGGLKSSYVSEEIPLLMIQHPECHAVVLRKVANTLRNSVYAQMEWAIDKLGMTGQWKLHTNPMEMIRKATGQKILFFGVDDKSKLKSIKLPFGYVGVVWYEELDQFAGMEEIRSLNQSLLRGGPIYWCFASYNPPKSRDNWVNTEMLIDDADRLVHHSNYLQVPREWLGEQFFQEADKLKSRNEKAYRHEYLGEVTGTGGSVFENVEDLRITDANMQLFDRRRYGLDFGFAVDPLAWIAMHYDAKYEKLYIFDEIYQPKLTNPAAVRMIKNRMEDSGIIRADSAEPKSIREMVELGLRVFGVPKPPGSIDYGIKWLQGLSAIVIDKRRCPNTYREFVSYEYEQTKDGQFISAYPDKNNHAIDAVRYGCEDLMPARMKVRAKRSNLY